MDHPASQMPSGQAISLALQTFFPAATGTYKGIDVTFQASAHPSPGLKDFEKRILGTLIKMPHSAEVGFRATPAAAPGCQEFEHSRPTLCLVGSPGGMAGCSGRVHLKAAARRRRDGWLGLASLGREEPHDASGPPLRLCTR